MCLQICLSSKTVLRIDSLSRGCTQDDESNVIMGLIALSDADSHL
jgi:hypothetical protein